MPKISTEMTMRDITAAVHRGDLDRRDADVQAALAERFDLASAAFKEIVSLVNPDLAPEVIVVDGEALAGVGSYFRQLRDDPEKLAIARRALGRIEDTFGSSQPCKVCFQLSEANP